MNPFVFDYPSLAKYTAHKSPRPFTFINSSALQGSIGKASSAIDTVTAITKHSTFSKGSSIENQQSVTTAGNNSQSKNSE